MKTSSVLKKTNRRVIIGITGGIAAYKTVELVRALQKEGATVKVIMTEEAKRFISPLVFETITNEPVYDDIFKYPLDHINIARGADLFVVAPATANTIAKLASGIADNPLCLTALAFKGPVLVVPAMNSLMYEHPIVQKNIKTLTGIGYRVMEPETGELACGYEGKGRMPAIEKIVSEIRFLLSEKDLTGLKVLVTAGPTREPIDPVRYISNRSSGKMGYAIAEVAKQRGAEVVLISGPTWLTPPAGTKTIKIETTEEMFRAVMDHIGWADVVIMAAAVSDFTIENTHKSKLPKSKVRTLKLKPTTDILKSITEKKKRPFVVGFAAETGPNLAKVKKEYFEKSLDMVVFNDVTEKGAGFEVDTNRITIFDGKETYDYPLMSKRQCAEVILDRVKEALKRQKLSEG